jgi:hypothetical protein
LVVWPLALGAGLTGCAADEDGADVATEQSVSALMTTGNFAFVTDSFAAPAGLGVIPIGQAPAQVVSDLVGAIRAAVTRLSCVTVETDQATYVEVTLDQCEILFGLLVLHGTFRAELSFESQPCGVGDLLECPAAVLFEISTLGFTLDAAHFAVEIAGAMQLRAPVAAGAPMSWTGDILIVTSQGASLAVSGQATWTRDGVCTTVTGFDAAMTLAGVATTAAELGTIAVSAQDVVRCMGSCPQSGTVHVAWGQGQLASFSYTGADTVLVTGPRGRTVEVTLPCANDR